MKGARRGLAVKNLSAYAGNVGLILGSGRSLGEVMATHLPGKPHGVTGYSPWGPSESDMT